MVKSPTTITTWWLLRGTREPEVEVYEMEGNGQLVLQSVEDGTLLSRSAAESPFETKVKLTPHWNARSVMVLGCCWLVYLVVSTESSVLGPFFPTEAGDRGVSSALIGLIFSASPFCVLVLSPLLGYHLVKLGVKRLLICGTILTGGAYFILGFIDYLPPGASFVSYGLLLQLAQGIGCAMVSTSASVLVTSLFQNHYATIMGLMELAAGVGYTIGPVIGGLLYQLGGFKLPFIVLGASTLLLTIPLAVLIQEIDPEITQLTPKAIFMIIGNCSVILIALSNILATAALCFFTPTLSPFLVKQFNLPPFHVGLVYLADSVMYMTVSVISGPLLNQCNTRLLIIIGLLTAGVGFFFIGPIEFITTPKLWITILSTAIIGFGCALSIIVSYADIMSIAKSLNTSYNTESLSAITSGIVFSSFSCGELIGPLIGGGLNEILDFQTSAMVFGEIVLAQAVLISVFSVCKCR